MDGIVLPNNVDCVVLGTGLTNSIVAAACSRIGKSVLHIDKNDYYGHQWASFTFQSLIDWIKSNYPGDESLNDIPEEFVEKSRQFCIDLNPRLINSNGDMVNLLVKSNVARYHEFKNNIRILSLIDNNLHVLPCRRSEVFTSSLLSDLVDKRRLMKFFETCCKYEPGSENPEVKELELNAKKPIVQYLEEKGLKHTLRELIINSVAMVSHQDPTEKACEQIRTFMTAIERFGRSPFLFSLYGCGEFPQSFCRLSAVFGGTYCLKTQVDDVKFETIEDHNFSVKLSHQEQPVRSKHLVVDYDSASSLKLSIESSGEKLSRAILITDKSIVFNPEQQLSFLRIPHEGNVVYLLELNSSVMICPPNLNIVYLWTKSSSSSAKEDLNKTIEQVMGQEPDLKVLWRFYFQQTIGPAKYKELNNLHVSNPPCGDIDYSSCIKEAEQIFSKICPDEEFLPRAPDHDEVIYSDS